MSDTTQHKPSGGDNNKANKFAEDPDLDSGFCSSVISGPVSELLSSDSIETEQAPPSQNDNKNQDQSKSSSSNSNNNNNKTNPINPPKIVTNDEDDDNMDSAYCDSAMLSEEASIETNLAKLVIDRDEDHQQSNQQSPNKLFESNDEGDT